jgi:hypothetical protein
MDEQGQTVAKAPAQKVSLRAWAIAAGLLATAALCLLGRMALHHDFPLLKIADLRPALDGALIRVAGQATGDARTFREAGQLRSLSFTVDDGTGELAVVADGQQAAQMALFDRIPRAGDTLEVAGRLSIGAEGHNALHLQSGDALKLRRAEKGKSPMTATQGLADGAQAQVTGIVTRVIAPRSGSRAPYVVTVRDAAGERPLIIGSGVFEQIAGHDRLVPGAAIRARVTAEKYEGQLQLTLGHAADLEFATPPAAPPTNAAPGVPRH